MAQRRRHLELCRRRGLVWLLVSDGREFSASSAAKLVELLRSLGSEDPLALNANDRITVRRPVADFAPVLEALRPREDLIPVLEQKINDSDSWPHIFDLGTSVNGRRWAWLAAEEPDHRTHTSIVRWQLVPSEFIKEPVIFSTSARFRDSMAGAFIQSSVMLHDSVSVETGEGDEGSYRWIAVRYDATGGPWVAMITHLRRPSMGLGDGGEVACPFCPGDPFQGWESDIWTSPEVGQDFIGVALVRLYKPCEAHKAVRREVDIEGSHYVWRYGFWIEPDRVPVWRRVLKGKPMPSFLLPGEEEA